MIVHHFVTITLMVMSWTANMVRVGTLVMCVHDAVDYFLEVRKLRIFYTLSRFQPLGLLEPRNSNWVRLKVVKKAGEWCKLVIKLVI